MKFNKNKIKRDKKNYFINLKGIKQMYPTSFKKTK